VCALRYEDLTVDLHGAVKQVFRHLGEAGDVPAPTPRLGRQADAESAAWIDRFQAER